MLAPAFMGGVPQRQGRRRSMGGAPHRFSCIRRCRSFWIGARTWWWGRGSGGAAVTISKSARKHHRRGESPHWRNYLHSHERPDLEALELNVQELDEKRRRLSFEIT